MAYCNKCGTQLSDGAKFCPKCGNPCGDSTDNITEDSSSTSKKSLIITLAVVAVLALIGGSWYFLRGENPRDTISETQEENIQEEEKQFIEKFYADWKQDADGSDYAYVKKYITANALKTLKDEYDYECDGECLATWLFFYEAGGDMDSLLSRQIEPVSPNTFLVTNTWGYSEGSSDTYDYKIRLGIVKDGGSYKINSIVNVSREELEKTARKQVEEQELDDTRDIDNQQEFNAKAMSRVNEIQQIMIEMNNVYNQYVSVASSSGSNQNLGVNAVSTISDLRLKGDKLFRELISLARNAGKSNELNAFQQEMNDFDRKAQKMERTITQDMYSY